MLKIKVEKVANSEQRTLPVFAEIEALLGHIRASAYARSEARGFRGEQALDDWLIAEREFCGLSSELTERDGSYLFSVAVPRFEAPDIEVIATPRELIVHAKAAGRKSPAAGDMSVRFSEFRDEVYRRIELPQDIEVRKVTATLESGVLTVAAPKVEATRTETPESEAA